MVNLMKTRNILFIVEGKNDEPRFIEQLLSKCYPSSVFKMYSYEANLHMLASRLEKDYYDFEEDELDILLFMKSYETKHKEIFNLKYTDIYLIFDFEPQHPDLHYETIQKMIRYFNQSDERGKLFINYPMMQSYRHLKSLPDKSFLQSKLDRRNFNHYKEIVSNESFNNAIASYDYTTFVSLAFHHLTKLLFIQSKKLSIPTIEDYDQLNYAKIFDIQYENLQNDYIWIVNTCIVILIDYKPLAFFSQISKHETTFRLPSIKQS